MARWALTLLGLIASAARAQTPAAPILVNYRVLFSDPRWNDTTDVVQVSWTAPVGAVAYHIRLVPAASIIPAFPPALDVSAVIPSLDPSGGWHQLAGTRTADTFLVRLHPGDSIAAIGIVRAVTASVVVGPWGISPVHSLTRLPPAPPPPLPPPPPPLPPPPPPPPPVLTVASVFWLTPRGISSDSGTGPYIVSAIPQDSLFRRLLVPLAWASSDTSVTKVFADVVPGMSEVATVYLRKPGTTTITASAQGKSASTTFTVLSPKPPPAPVLLSVSSGRVLNVPSRWLFKLPALLPTFSGTLPVWSGVYAIDLYPGSDTTVIAGHARCTVAGP
jgi:hypothetical protein